MNSPTNSQSHGRKWIVTTCRGRLAHLRESLPSWLEYLPDWDPVIVCCDDGAATEYASGEVVLAGRGICVTVFQGQYFNKLEAIRLGANVAASGFPPDGRTIDALNMPPPDECGFVGGEDMIAQLDADTIATPRTAAGLALVDAQNVGIAGWGTKDDMGVIVAPLGVFLKALESMPVGWFEGYGPEDSALRVACWVHVRKSFVDLPMCWRRRQHTDRERQRFHSRAVAGAVRKNQEVMNQLIRRLVAPEDQQKMRADCLRWVKKGHAE
jgi:hypothetical protein